MVTKQSFTALVYFVKRDENTAMCSRCKPAISRRGGNASNMLKYPLSQHGTQSQECRRALSECCHQCCCSSYKIISTLNISNIIHTVNLTLIVKECDLKAKLIMALISINRKRQLHGDGHRGKNQHQLRIKSFVDDAIQHEPHCKLPVALTVAP